MKRCVKVGKNSAGKFVAYKWVFGRVLIYSQHETKQDCVSWIEAQGWTVSE